MDLKNSRISDDNSLKERFEQLSRQSQQQNERFGKLSETVMMEALENLTQDKHKYREGEHLAAQTCRKRARLRLSANK